MGKHHQFFLTLSLRQSGQDVFEVFLFLRLAFKLNRNWAVFQAFLAKLPCFFQSSLWLPLLKISKSFCPPGSVAFVERVIEKVLYFLFPRLELNFLDWMLELWTHHNLGVLRKLLRVVDSSLHEMADINVFWRAHPCFFLSFNHPVSTFFQPRY